MNQDLDIRRPAGGRRRFITMMRWLVGVRWKNRPRPLANLRFVATLSWGGDVLDERNWNNLGTYWFGVRDILAGLRRDLENL